MEVISNFLIRPVQIQVQNNQNKSRDSPPCGIQLYDFLFTSLAEETLQKWSLFLK